MMMMMKAVRVEAGQSPPSVGKGGQSIAHGPDLAHESFYSGMGSYCKMFL
jgi:hypothetical protein